MLLNTSMNKETVTARCRLEDYEFDLRVFANETLGDACVEKGYHGHNDVAILDFLLQPGSTFVDIGANIGWYTVLVSKIKQDQCNIVAFEPSTDNCQLLQENCHLNEVANVTILTQAVSDHDGVVDFYINPENCGDHSVSPQTYQRCFVPDPRAAAPISVPSITLDSYFDDDSFSRVGLIKMDIQGHEPRALQGCMQRLHQHLPPMIIEYSPAHIYAAGGSPFELLGIMDRLQYLPLKIKPQRDFACAIEILSIDHLLIFTKQNHNTFQNIDILWVHKDDSRLIQLTENLPMPEPLDILRD
jgi:FkbM family methyltransferase